MSDSTSEKRHSTALHTSALTTKITKAVEIRLEHEAHYDWVAFVPQRESDAGALMKYFGKVAGDDESNSEGLRPAALDDFVH